MREKGERVRIREASDPNGIGLYCQKNVKWIVNKKMKWLSLFQRGVKVRIPCTVSGSDFPFIDAFNERSSNQGPRAQRGFLKESRPHLAHALKAYLAINSSVSSWGAEKYWKWLWRACGQKLISINYRYHHYFVYMKILSNDNRETHARENMKSFGWGLGRNII